MYREKQPKIWLDNVKRNLDVSKINMREEVDLAENRSYLQATFCTFVISTDVIEEMKDEKPLFWLFVVACLNSQAPFPQIDITKAIMIVWRVRGKVISLFCAVLCRLSGVIHSCSFVYVGAVYIVCLFTWLPQFLFLYLFLLTYLLHYPFL